ncbi:TrmJ/YjtD family RNA methyltransferase [Synechocystis salina LEGE 06099]|uniref:TrmJ/YjtD family RNA methyltransferase n=1 Tax=Synechocystis salina TaxID=945780 RepID=UPI00187F1E74|nr:TrmJ/YjtD family RNA methyltransferase [Synechocystis salina]MBE9204184.1 TrmJ/YjtD family RNA methyltransferase [Synechocystis salina LEGE 06099]
MENIAIVVVEPQGERNLGAIARAMKNMGLGELILVNPRCDYQSVEAQTMAVHAKEVLAQARVVDDLATALGDRQRIIATSARERILQSPMETPRQALPWLLAPNLKSALVFGREDRGLSNEELNQAHRFVRIPVHPQYPSLNLSQAVMVCTYELYQATLAMGTENQAQGDRQEDGSMVPLATNGQLDSYCQHLEKTLLNIQVLYPHTAPSKMAKLRRIYQRAALNSEEVALLRGILGQIDWLAQQIKL